MMLVRVLVAGGRGVPIPHPKSSCFCFFADGLTPKSCQKQNQSITIVSVEFLYIFKYK